MDSNLHRRLAFELVALSFVVLFQELSLIRWLPIKIRVLAYFPNLILLSAFLGLGLGCLRTGRRSLLWLWPCSLVVLIAAGVGMSKVAFTQQSPSDHLWLLYYDLEPDAWVIQDVRLPIIVTFLLSTASFIPLGQLVAERLQRFRTLSKPLWGYSYDIAGSLLGVGSFAVICFLETGPILWFSVFLGVGALFFLASRRLLLGYALAAVVVLLTLTATERADRYSPYYAISAASKRYAHFGVLSNGSLHQFAFPSARGSPLNPRWEEARTGYHLPYTFLKSPPKRVLVLGAGTGNDVAVALDQGAERVDAVEIDPVILDLGRKFHPNQPYASPRVRAWVMDARSFLNDSREQYDLIVFGTLDSMTRLSALSNVRLDSFVYTLDGLRAARARLSPDGGIVMYFMVGEEYIGSRLHGMLAQALNQPPIVVRNSSFLLFNNVYMGGPAFAAGLTGHKPPEIQPSAVMPQNIALASDDWPFLYLKRRGISSFYLTLLCLFALVAVSAVFIASKEMRMGLAGKGEFDSEMFCFGLAFLLLETKAVTQINLLWGATWLTMVLFATVLMQLRPIPFKLAFAGLALSLVISYGVPAHMALGSSTGPKLAFSFLFVGLPIFFASACFAVVFATRKNADLAFGWNLLGAVAGGLLEFLSMAVGLKALALAALAAYSVAGLVRLRRAGPIPTRS